MSWSPRWTTCRGLRGDPVSQDASRRVFASGAIGTCQQLGLAPVDADREWHRLLHLLDMSVDTGIHICRLSARHSEPVAPVAAADMQTPIHADRYRGDGGA